MSKDSPHVKQGYTGPRPDILKLIKPHPLKVLDIGCGSGKLGRSIKQIWPDTEIIGIENDPILSATASKHLDKVIQCDLDCCDLTQLLADEDDFSVIIFADVLEHLANPEKVLALSHDILKPDGYIITSLPNIRHYSTFISLGVLGTWPQRDRGIHDKTHLRFFAHRDIIRLLNKCGFRIVEEHRNVRLIESWSWTNIPGKLLDFWPFRHFLTFQYLHRSVPD